MTQDSSQHASKRLQHRPKTASSGQGAYQGGPREAKILQKPLQNNVFLPSRFRWALEASRWLQDGPRVPQDGPKTGPRGGSRTLSSGVPPQETATRSPQAPKKEAPRRLQQSSQHVPGRPLEAQDTLAGPAPPTSSLSAPPCSGRGFPEHGRRTHILSLMFVSICRMI